MPATASQTAGPAPPGPSPGEDAARGSSGHSYEQILKSSALIGGSSVFNVAAGVVRAKAFAVLLGPAGFGLMGLYTSILGLAQSLAGMGVNSSGVRQIAAAVGSDETGRIAMTAAVLRRVSVVLGLVGALLLVALSGELSRLTFGDAGHAGAVALLSLAVLFKVVSDGQAALVQGLRRIPDLARITVLGGLYGTVAGIALVFFLGEAGVVPALVAMALATLVVSWSASRRVALERPALTASVVGKEARALLALGFAFMSSALLTMGAAYVVRLLLLRRIGLDAAGLYQAAWTIGGLYVGFVLQAMGADFYPRLTAVVKERRECNRLVNEQAQVSLLLAGPGVIATLAFAPLVLPLLYSGAFADAVGVLRWICLGAALKVITWPIGFIVVAEGRQTLFLATEVAYTVIHVALAWALVGIFGVDGAGMAFFLSYVAHGLIVYPLVRRISGFRWSAANAWLGLGFLAMSGAVFGAFHVLPWWLATAFGALALVASTAYSVRALGRLLPPERLPAPARRVLRWLGLGPRPPPPGDAP